MDIENEHILHKSVVNTIKYYYDEEGQVTKKVITPVSGASQTIFYETSEDNTVVKFTAGGRTITSHSKTDSFGRKVFDELQLGTDFVSRQFVYHTGEVTQEHKVNEKVKSSATTQLVSQILLSDGRKLSYEYDAEERITKVTDSIEGETEYAYDSLGQLKSETVNGVKTKFKYDNYGNITAKGVVDETGAIAEATKDTYVYGNGVWKDLLTSYNGQAIEYDAQGNPISYLGHTLTWEKGRQLKQFVKSDGTSISYTYNANGIRTSKTVNGVEHTYTLDGTKILCEEWGENSIVPLYDNEESVCGILYNEEPYYFTKNLQGDIISIVNKAGGTVARYSYDAWGVPTITQDILPCRIAEINPYRYRGYYYDSEIGMYYLQSRYYDPAVGRFVNADENTTILLSQYEIINYNLFSYCKNSLTVFDDDLGLFSFSDIKKFFNKIINGLKKRIEKYFKSLIVKKKRYISISTDVFSTAINLILGLILRSYVVKIFNTGLKIFKCTYLASRTGIAVEIIRKIVELLLNNGFGKFLVNMMAKCVVSSAGLSVSFVKVVAEGLFNDFVNSVNKLAAKASIVVSAFSSVGNLLAFVFCDLPDGKIDGRLTVVW